MILRKILVIILCLFLIFGCYRNFKTPKEKIESDQQIMEVTLTNGDQVMFGKEGGKLTPDRTVITGESKDGKALNINMKDVSAIKVRKLDVAATAIFSVAGGIVAGVVITYLTKESCPFVYSYNGETYMFDAEPLGGAIAQGLERTDYSRLEHLKQVDGVYHLMFRNEVRETQYTDAISLLVMDHPKDTQIIPDLEGNMYLFKKVEAPIRARDENGKSLMKFVAARDDIAWQTQLSTNDSFRNRSLRHQLTFEFPKPAGVKKARLVVNAGTALWGSHMIRAMLELRGNRVDSWYQAVNSGGPEVAELMEFIEREELYVLKIHVQEGESWVQKGIIMGQGPFINEDRVFDLDLSGVTGDKISIRLNPPMGFWAIDSLAVSYDDSPTLPVEELHLVSTEDHYGKDVSELLLEKEGKYQELPEVGDWFKAKFKAPAEQKGFNRTVFLKTSGYYEIHLSKDQPEQTDLIQALMKNPGSIVQYSMEEYLRWRSESAQVRNASGLRN